MDVKALVGKLPPPGKLGARPAPLGDDDGDEGAPEYGSDEDEAAETSACQEFLNALGLKGVDAGEACAALKRFLDIVRPEG